MNDREGSSSAGGRQRGMRKKEDAEGGEARTRILLRNILAFSGREGEVWFFNTIPTIIICTYDPRSILVQFQVKRKPAESQKLFIDF